MALNGERRGRERFEDAGKQCEEGSCSRDVEADDGINSEWNSRASNFRSSTDLLHGEGGQLVVMDVGESSGSGRDEKRRNNVQVSPKSSDSCSLGKILDLVSILSHLAFFSMVGVLLRVGLETLFGPKIGHVTDPYQALYVGLLPNMVGSFLAGWAHVVFRPPLVLFSLPLSAGLSAGMSTLVDWNMRMLAIAAQGCWVRAGVGYVIGLELAYFSLLVGIDSANALSHFIERWREAREGEGKSRPLDYAPDNVDRRWRSLLFMFPASVLLCFGAAAGTAVDLNCLARRRIWLAVLSGPLGTWIRWYLAQFNGWGYGKDRKFSWLPVGTLMANLLATMLAAAISVVEVWADSTAASLVARGLQLGLLGCMSTVSGLTVEMYQLYKTGSHRWRVYAYPIITILSACVTGVLIYNVPISALGLPSQSNHKDTC